MVSHATFLEILTVHKIYGFLANFVVLIVLMIFFGYPHRVNHSPYMREASLKCSSNA